MSEQELKALFLLAGIEIKSQYKLGNEYWPDHDDYKIIRRNSPWWLVSTKFGLIKIGWRKRVIEINWTGTAYRDGTGQHFKNRPEDLILTITEDDVTKSPFHVHAYGYDKAVNYLATLHLRLQQVQLAYDLED